MATWISHLRIADFFLERIPDYSRTDFIVGNLGPDSGVPNEDWSSFTPSTEISHWRNIEMPNRHEKEIDFNGFANKYLNQKSQGYYFYLGYYMHLLSDYFWGQLIYLPKYIKFQNEMNKNPQLIWEIKKDWYDLDFEYLNTFTKFEAYSLFIEIKEFRNIYLDYFSENAFTRQILYIQDFYKKKKELIGKEYKYLKKEEMEYYIKEVCKKIESIVSDKNLTIAST